MLASAAVAFTLFLWLLLYGRDHSRADFSAYADAHGWNHRHDGPLHLVAEATALDGAVTNGAPHGPYFAGPSGAGPFQVMGVRAGRSSPRAPGGSWNGDRTLVHVRTATSSPGLTFGPRQAGGTAMAGDDGWASAVGHTELLARYRVDGRDRDFVASALDYDSCALLLQPQGGVIGSWQGHDLYLMFPVRPGTMAGYETLLRYSVALVRRLERVDGRAMPVAARPAAARVAPIGEPLTARGDAMPA